MFVAALLIIISFLFYILFAVEKRPESISQTYYLLGGRGWLMQVVLIAVGLMLIIPWMERSREALQWLVFLACGGLLFVGVAPQFRLKLEGAVHYVSAAVCCVCSVAWQIAMGEWMHLPLFALAAALFSMADRRCYMWYVEWAVIGSLFFVLL